MENSLILFDIDWTLLAGGLPEHIDGFSYAWKKVLGIDAKLSDWPDHHGQPDAVLLSQVPQICRGINASVISDKIEELKKAKSDYFFSHAQKDYHGLVLPGAADLLQTLKDKSIPLAIKSGNLEDIGKYRLEKSGLLDYFLTGGWGDNVSSKEESVEIAIKSAENLLKIKFSRQNIFDVGDSKYDVRADKSAKIKSIGVCSGYDKRDDLRAEGADFVLENLTHKEEFLKIIKREV